MPANTETVVIAGASLAGAKAAETLRSEGFEGRVLLVGEEPLRPYERPPLSKEYLRGEKGFDEGAVHEEGFYAAQDIELLTGTKVAHLDLVAREVTLSSGERAHYDPLLLATGAFSRRLEVPGAELDGVFYLRTVADGVTTPHERVRVTRTYKCTGHARCWERSTTIGSTSVSAPN